MYQQYVNEARVTQYQQQCRCEAATERSVRIPRMTQLGRSAVALAALRRLCSGAWLPRLPGRPAGVK